LSARPRVRVPGGCQLAPRRACDPWRVDRRAEGTTDTTGATDTTGTTQPGAQAPRGAEPQGGARPRRWWVLTVVVGVLLVLALAGTGLARAVGGGAYAEDSPEVGFTRDMYLHHGQAVTMSLLVRERGSDPLVAAFAEEVITGQAEQQGVMLGWLHREGVPATSSVTPMAWMDHGGAGGAMDHGAMDHGAMDHGAMDHGATADGAGAMTQDQVRAAMGMATDEELAALGRASGTEADLLYVRLMAPHHVAAVEMAEAFLAQSDEPQLTWLAEAVVTGQERELAILADLEERLVAETGS
jgi:uncharacterized protein (DUF305 family)